LATVFFQVPRLPKSYLEVFWQHRRHFAKRLHPVFADINNGGPYGRWLAIVDSALARLRNSAEPPKADARQAGLPCSTANPTLRNAARTSTTYPDPSHM
jgi:hypothetical protein